MSSSTSRPAAGAAPVVAVALAIAVLSAMDASIKSLGGVLPVTLIVALRYAAGALWALPVYLATGPHRIDSSTLRTNGLRAAVMLVAAWTFYYAIINLPLAEAVTLAFTAPLFVVFIARLVLGEPIRSHTIIGILIGLAGVAIVASSGSGAGGRLTPDGIAAALVSAVSYAYGIVLLRKHAVAAPVPVLVFMQQVLGAVLMVPLAIVTWTGFDLSTGGILLLIGFFGTSGHLLMAWGFARAEAGRLAPLEYTGFVWAVLFGWLLFNEAPAITTYVGAVAIVTASAVATSGRWPIYPRRWMLRRR